MKKNLFQHHSKPDPDSRQVIQVDKWDKQRQAQAFEEVKDYAVSTEKLGNEVITGAEMMGDAYYSLLKAAPKLKDPADIRPSYRINGAVMEEAMALNDYEDLRQISIGDHIGAALAASALEPSLEVIFEKMEKSLEKSKELEDLLNQMAAAQEEMTDIDELLASASGKGEGEEGDFDAQKQKKLIEEQMKKLQAMLDATEAELDEALAEEIEEAKPAIQKAVKEALGDAKNYTGFDAWGLDPGGLQKLPVDKRLELANKLKSEKFKKMSEIFGRLQRAAIAEQHSKVVYTQDEIHDTELGADLMKVLPTEMLTLDDDVLVLDWFRKYAERSLCQYALYGEDKVAQGGIILLEDGSGSMSGEREIWAKGIGLALLKIASMQKRPFYAVHFGSTGEYKLFEYDTSGPALKLKSTYKKKVKESSGIEAVLEYAETFFGGGTCLMTPMSVALERMDEDFKSMGALDADIVFLTDGMCGVHDEFMKNFKKEQARLGFNIYGIIIGAPVTSEPLYTICDKRVISPSSIVDASDVRELFRKI